MPKEGQPNKALSAQKVQPKPQAVLQQADGELALAELMSDARGLISRLNTQGVEPRLGDSRLHAIQRQILANHIGQAHGNGCLQRTLTLIQQRQRIISNEQVHPNNGSTESNGLVQKYSRSLAEEGEQTAVTEDRIEANVFEEPLVVDEVTEAGPKDGESPEFATTKQDTADVPVEEIDTDESTDEQSVSQEGDPTETDNLTDQSRITELQSDRGQENSSVQVDSKDGVNNNVTAVQETTEQPSDSSITTPSTTPNKPNANASIADTPVGNRVSDSLQSQEPNTIVPDDGVQIAEASAGGGLTDLDTSNLALIDEELAEHERWAGATDHVGVAESTDRAGFIAEAAGGGLLGGAAQGAAMGLGMGLVGRAAARFVPIPGVGSIIGGVAAAFSAADAWKEASNALDQMGQGSSEYEVLANNIAAISAFLNVVTNTLNIVAGIVGIISAAMWIITVATVGIASPLAATLSSIALGIGVASGIIDAINAAILQPCVALFRSMHTFKSQADPRQVETQGAGIAQAAAASGAALGGFVGGKMSEVGGSSIHPSTDTEAPHPQPEAAPPPAAAAGEGPAVHFDPPATADLPGGTVDVPGGAANIEVSAGTIDVPSGANPVEAPAGVVEAPSGSITVEAPAATAEAASSAPPSATGEAGDSLTGMQIESAGTPDGSLQNLSDADIDNFVNNIETNARSDTYVELPAGRDVTTTDAAGVTTTRPETGVQSIEVETSNNPNAIAFHEKIGVTGVETVSTTDRGTGQVTTSDVPLHGETGQPRDLQVRTHSPNPNAPKGSLSRDNPTLQVNTDQPQSKSRYLTDDGRWTKVNKNTPDVDAAAAHFPVGEHYTRSGDSSGGNTPSSAGPAPVSPAPTSGGTPEGSVSGPVEPLGGSANGDTLPTHPDAPDSTDIQSPEPGGAGHTDEADFSSLNWAQELEETPFADQLDYTLPDIPEAPAGTNYDSAHKSGAARFRQQTTMPEGTQAQHWSKKLDAEAAGLPTDLMNENMSALQSRKDLPAETLLTDYRGGGTTYSIDGTARPPGTVHPGDPTYQTEHKFADNYLIPSIRDRMPADVDPRTATLWAGAEARWVMTGDPDPGNWGPQPPPLGQSSTPPTNNTPTTSGQSELASSSSSTTVKNVTSSSMPQSANQPSATSSPTPESVVNHNKAEDGNTNRVGAAAAVQPGVVQVSPNYPPPPGTPQQLQAIQEEIVNLLAVRARAESAEQQMAQQERKAQADAAPIQQTVQQSNQQLSASRAHQQAVARRQQLNQSQQQRQQDAGSKIESYADRATGLAALTVPLHAFERFSHYAALVPGSVGNSMMRMNTDARKLQSSFAKLALEMAGQQASQATIQGDLQTDQARLEQTDQQAAISQEHMQQASEGAVGLQQANQQKITESAEAHAEATQQREEFTEATDTKQEQAKTLQEQLQTWSTAHKAARDAAIVETEESIQSQGGVVTEVKEI